MLAVSLNIGGSGIVTFLKKVALDYGSITTWIERHQIDIFALQEVKCANADSIDAILLPPHQDYDSFWSICQPGKKLAGKVHGRMCLKILPSSTFPTNCSLISFPKKFC